MNMAQTPLGSAIGSGAYTFLLYSDDTLLADRLDRALTAIGVVLSRHGDIGDLIREVSLLGPDAVLLVFDEHSTQSHDVAKQLAEFYPSLALIGVGTPTEAAMHSALKAGVEEFIDVGNLALASSIVYDTLCQHDDGQPQQNGCPLIALVGARQGMGTSSVATELALRMKARLGDDEVLLLDCGAPVRDCSLYLGLEPELDMLGAVHNLARFDRMMLQTAFSRHAQGLAVLPLPAGIEERNEIGTADALRLFRILRSYFRVVVVDLGFSPDPLLAQHLVRSADSVLLVCEQGISGLKASLDYLSQCEAAGFGTSNWRVVINRYAGDRAVNAEHLAHRFGLPLAAVLPHDAAALNDAQSFGKPLSSQGKLGRELDSLATQLLAELGLGGGGKHAESLSLRLSRLFVKTETA
ncbi:AAA family ATPase [Jeongeupia chitinilytica]|uniref:Fimbrial protein n=1 Tax=Jeongeupia chitinilytica TaxID=1041641 RepID=A0ABQ3H2R8_9NEIS|nr:hypothetical protein [Jeongeupia chitinilytica]GHD62051.1 fimbrial protein [Jeongeupia chitinilytica]